MSDPIILTATGAIILGLFAVVWYFVQKFITKTETNDNALVSTLDKLNKTMNELNISLLLFRSSADKEFSSLHEKLKEVVENGSKTNSELKKLDERVGLIEKCHIRNHPQDKL